MKELERKTGVLVRLELPSAGGGTEAGVLAAPGKLAARAAGNIVL